MRNILNVHLVINKINIIKLFFMSFFLICFSLCSPKRMIFLLVKCTVGGGLNGIDSTVILKAKIVLIRLGALLDEQNCCTNLHDLYV